MTDLTLNEYRSFPEMEIKKVLLEEKLKMHVNAFAEGETIIRKRNMFKRTLSIMKRLKFSREKTN